MYAIARRIGHVYRGNQRGNNRFAFLLYTFYFLRFKLIVCGLTVKVTRICSSLPKKCVNRIIKKSNPISDAKGIEILSFIGTHILIGRMKILYSCV